MCVNLSLTLMLLFLSGAVCSERNVTYHQWHICAVKGSSVVIPCSFYYPKIRQVMRVMWGHEWSNIFNGPFIFDSEMKETASRFQYIGNKQHNCSFKIHGVENNHAGSYAFRFMTDDKSNYTGTAGSTLKVVDLNVSVTKPNVNDTTQEGDSVNLTCINGCDGDHLSSAFTWFKNGEPINKGPVLYLSNMSSTASGNYSCSLKTHTGTASRVINIHVEYGPKNTSVSVRPSMELEAGTNITLICSSHANPPVEDYTWFKINESHVLDVGHQPVLFSADGGQYFCSATNKHGSQNSSVVTVKIKERWPSFNRDVLIIILTGAVLLIVITVFVTIRLKKIRQRAQETNCEQDREDAVYMNMTVCDEKQSKGRSQGSSEEKRTRAQETNCEEDIEDAVYDNMTVCDEKQSQQRSQGSSEKKRTRAQETNCEEDIEDAVYDNWSAFDNNQSQGRSHGRSEKRRTRAQETNCEEDIEDAVYVTMTVCDEKQSQQGSQGRSRQTPTMMRKV